MRPSIAEPAPAWATSDHLENYALTLGKISPEDYDAEHDSADRYAVAAAAKTTKLEIKEYVTRVRYDHS
jgi:hypothetical protein